MVYLFYTTYISVYLAHHEIFCAKVGKGSIKALNWRVILASPKKPNEISYSFQLDQSISVLMVVGWYFSFLHKF